MINRSCGKCTACCEGWLQGEAYGNKFYPGKVCPFVALHKGCTIYETRPYKCADFECVWLAEDILPEHFHPYLSKIIVVRRKWGENQEKDYLQIKECGTKINEDLLNWFLNYHKETGMSLDIEIDRVNHYYGSTDFENYCRMSLPHIRKPLLGWAAFETANTSISIT